MGSHLHTISVPDHLEPLAQQLADRSELSLICVKALEQHARDKNIKLPQKQAPAQA